MISFRIDWLDLLAVKKMTQFLKTWMDIIVPAGLSLGPGVMLSYGQKRGFGSRTSLVKKLLESFLHKTNVLIKGLPRDGSGWGGSLSLSLFFQYSFIYVLGCVGSQLWHIGSSIGSSSLHVDSLVAACRLSSWQHMSSIAAQNMGS